MEAKNTLNHTAGASEYAASAEAAHLQQKLAEAQAALEKAHAAFVDADTERAFVRRRMQEDIAHAHKYALEGFARSLLAIKDNLETALAIETQDHEAFKQGIDLIHKQLVAAFETFGLREIAPQVGEPFDPSRHRTAASVPDGRLQHVVTEVCEKGYQIGDRLLRPALVAI